MATPGFQDPTQNTMNYENLKKQEKAKQEVTKNTSSTYDDLWNRYVSAYTNAGITPNMDRKAFNSYASSANDKEGFLAVQFEGLYTKAAEKYNQAQRDWAKAAGVALNPNNLMNTKYDYTKQGDWRGKGADFVLGQINNTTSSTNDIIQTTNQIVENKPPEYKFEMPTEWTDIETIANATLKQGRPEFDASKTKSWTNEEGTGYLDTLYKPAEEKLKRTQKNMWATLFPYGGGTGTQAANDLSAFKDLNTDKLARALDFAKGDYAQKIADFTDAENRIANIGNVKVQADQFKSGTDATNYWNTMQQYANQQKSLTDLANENARWQKEAALAEYLAKIGKPNTDNDWMLPTATVASGIAVAI